MDIGQCLRHKGHNVASYDDAEMYFEALNGLGISDYATVEEMLEACAEEQTIIEREEAAVNAQSLLTETDGETGARLAEEMLELLLAKGYLLESDLSHDANGKCYALERINARKALRTEVI